MLPFSESGTIPVVVDVINTSGGRYDPVLLCGVLTPGPDCWPERGHEKDATEAPPDAKLLPAFPVSHPTCPPHQGQFLPVWFLEPLRYKIGNWVVKEKMGSLGWIN